MCLRRLSIHCQPVTLALNHISRSGNRSNLQSISMYPERHWLIDCLQFYVPLKNFSLIWRRHHCRWRAAKFRPMLGAQGLWAGRNLYCDTPAVTRDLGFSGLIRRTAPFSRLLRHTRGCGGSILTRILTGQKRHYDWYETHQTAFDIKESCTGKSYRFDDGKMCGMLPVSERVETPVISSSFFSCMLRIEDWAYV
jgi:hypothetical protein